MGKRGGHTKIWNNRISKALKGRVPWNKGVGLEHPSIRKGIKTRREFKVLRELLYALLNQDDETYG